jgi:hypothetical protein
MPELTVPNDSVTVSTPTTWGVRDDAVKREQLKLVYDYIKFHIGLYVGTPAVLGVLADAFQVKQSPIFQLGLALVVCVCLFAGIHAGLFMSRHVNDPWREGYLSAFESGAFSKTRRFVHHGMYWAGLGFGLVSILAAAIQRAVLV